MDGTSIFPKGTGALFKNYPIFLIWSRAGFNALPAKSSIAQRAM
jgi:hypothetical protein